MLTAVLLTTAAAYGVTYQECRCQNGADKGLSKCCTDVSCSYGYNGTLVGNTAAVCCNPAPATCTINFTVQCGQVYTTLQSFTLYGLKKPDGTTTTVSSTSLSGMPTGSYSINTAGHTVQCRSSAGVTSTCSNTGVSPSSFNCTAGNTVTVLVSSGCT